MPSRLSIPLFAPLLVVVLGLLTACTTIEEAQPTQSPLAVSPQTPAEPGDPFAVVVDVVSRVEASVVTVLTDSGLGSGIIYSAEGAIVTNNHVIVQANKIAVALATGEQFPAQLVGSDPETDVAVLRIDQTGLLTQTAG